MKGLIFYAAIFAVSVSCANANIIRVVNKTEKQWGCQGMGASSSLVKPNNEKKFDIELTQARCKMTTEEYWVSCPPKRQEHEIVRILPKGKTGYECKK